MHAFIFFLFLVLWNSTHYFYLIKCSVMLSRRNNIAPPTPFSKHLTGCYIISLWRILELKPCRIRVHVSNFYLITLYRISSGKIGERAVLINLFISFRRKFSLASNTIRSCNTDELGTLDRVVIDTETFLVPEANVIRLFEIIKFFAVVDV